MTQFVVFSRFAFCFIASAILLIKLPADLTSSYIACSPLPWFNIIYSVWQGESCKRRGCCCGEEWGRSEGGIDTFVFTYSLTRIVTT